jgi:hypothetical protein
VIDDDGESPADCIRAAFAMIRISVRRRQLGEMLHQLRKRAEGDVPAFVTVHELRFGPSRRFAAAQQFRRFQSDADIQRSANTEPGL